MGTVRRTGRSQAEDAKKTKRQPAGEGGDVATLERETARLRKELDSARQRTVGLEAASTKVAARLDAVIASIKAILERQG